jgi:hypothetical protein
MVTARDSNPGGIGDDRANVRERNGWEVNRTYAAPRLEVIQMSDWYKNSDLRSEYTNGTVYILIT